MHIFRRRKPSTASAHNGRNATTVGAGSQIGTPPFHSNPDIYQVHVSVPRGQLKPQSRWVKETVFEDSTPGPSEAVTIKEFQQDGYVIFDHHSSRAGQVPGKMATNSHNWHVHRPTNALIVESGMHWVVLTPIK